ncbi:MAG: hypothetical protein DMF82_01640 [Acidobacteria bacterium]|nr:MAG: hypothetical protein DMF82_01640 [Acidobacteriota bacterium]
MSLILEALKKLDREKKAPERGFLVVGAVPWPAPRSRRWLPVAAVVAAGAAAGLALVLAWRARGHEDSPGRAVVPTTMVAAATAVAPIPVTTLAAAPPPTLPPAAEGRPRASETRTPAPPALAPPIEAPPARLKTPPARAAEAGAGLQLQAISERDGKPIAVLNNRVVHEGDHFDGVTIVRIGVDGVEIEVQGRRRTLRF